MPGQEFHRRTSLETASILNHVLDFNLGLTSTLHPPRAWLMHDLRDVRTGETCPSEPHPLYSAA